MRFKGLLITVVVVLGLLFAVVNWQVLFTRMPVNLIVAVAEVPVGISLLVLAVGLSLLFFLASLWERAAQLRQVTSQERQIEALRGRLERQRSGELEALEEVIRERFDAVRQQIESDSGRVEANLREALEALEARQGELLAQLQERVVLVRNELAADIGELEGRLQGDLPVGETES
jgi:uncharacterized integral membrane protein